MPIFFLVGMLVISCISLLVILVVKQNIDHVTEGYIKIVGVQNKRLVKPHSIVLLEICYLLGILMLPVLFYGFTFLP